jgi:hypothetical protein
VAEWGKCRSSPVVLSVLENETYDRGEEVAVMSKRLVLPIVVVLCISLVSPTFAGFNHGEDIGCPIIEGMDLYALIELAIEDLADVNPEAAKGLQEMLDNGQINLGLGPGIDNAGALTLPDGEEGVEGDGINVNEGVATGGSVPDGEGGTTWRHNPYDLDTCTGTSWNNFVASLAHEWVHANTGGIPIPTSADQSATTDYCWEKPAYEKELEVLEALGEPDGFYSVPQPRGDPILVKTRREQLEQELNRKKKAAEEELWGKGLGPFAVSATPNGGCGGFICSTTDLAGDPVTASWFVDVDVLYCSVATRDMGVAEHLPIDEAHDFEGRRELPVGTEHDVLFVAGVSGENGVILGYEIAGAEVIGEVLNVAIPGCEPWGIAYDAGEGSLWVLDGAAKQVLVIADGNADGVPDAVEETPFATAAEFPALETAEKVYVWPEAPGIGVAPGGCAPYDAVNLFEPVTFLVDADSDGQADATVEGRSGDYAAFAPRFLGAPTAGALGSRVFGVAGAEVMLGTCDENGVFAGEVIAAATVGPDFLLDMEFLRPLAQGELVRLYDPVHELSEEAGVYEVPPIGWNHAPDPQMARFQLLYQDCSSGPLVTLDASGTFDAEGDGLTFEWQEVVDSYGSCPVLGTGPIIEVYLPPGPHSVRLIVSDGEAEVQTYCGVAVVPYLGHFSDVPGPNDPQEAHWAFWEVESAYQSSIVGGYGDGNYYPDWSVTRDQMAVYIARALAGGDENVPDPSGEPTFPDVLAGDWAYKHIEYAAAQNVVAGYEDDLYHPEYEVTRDQMAVYVARAMVAPTGEAALADYLPTDPRDFPDVPATGYGDSGTDPYWAYKHIEYCVENGVVAGYEDGLYHPADPVTRDQMAVYVARAFDLPM